MSQANSWELALGNLQSVTGNNLLRDIMGRLGSLAQNWREK
jgi:hypothetical protein